MKTIVRPSHTTSRDEQVECLPRVRHSWQIELGNTLTLQIYSVVFPDLR